MAMTQVLINDTWSEEISRSLAREFPNAHIHLLGPRHSGHPHGHMVLETILRSFGQSPIDVFMYAYLDEQDQDPLSWLHQAQKHGICLSNNSWGAVARGNEQVQSQLNLDGHLALFAAGNSDRSTAGHPDLKWDVNEPQRSLAHLSGAVVIGSCDVRGWPSTWSSDGLVDIAYRGERHWLLNPLTNKHEWVQGTSFACPLATADAARHGLETEEELKSFWDEHATTAPGWPVGMLHPKTGRGFMSDVLVEAPKAAVLSLDDYEVVS